MIFDGYRPWSITKLFWEVTSEDKRKFVANPEKGSKHNRGCAVDLSIYDLKTENLIEMPSGYDEFTERSSPDYPGGTEQQRANRDLLRAAMEAAGFTVNPNEWWHFDYKNWEDYAIYDIAFSEIGNKTKVKRERASYFRAWDRFALYFQPFAQKITLLLVLPSLFRLRSAAQPLLHPKSRGCRSAGCCRS